MKNLKIAVICSLLFAACSPSARYVISGTVPEDMNGKCIYMLQNGNFRYGESNTNQDSAWVENGKFRFVGRKRCTIYFYGATSIHIHFRARRDYV